MASGARLHAAAGARDAAAVRQILEDCAAAVHFRDEDTGATALHVAAALDAGACVAALLKHAPLLPARTASGDTPLHSAAPRRAGALRRPGESSRGSRQLRCGKHPPKRSSRPDSVGSRPYERRSCRLCGVGLPVLSKIVANQDRRAPFPRAQAAAGASDATEKLLAARQSPHIENDWGETPLHQAAAAGDAATSPRGNQTPFLRSRRGPNAERRRRAERSCAGHHQTSARRGRARRRRRRLCGDQRRVAAPPIDLTDDSRRGRGVDATRLARATRRLITHRSTSGGGRR